MDRERPDMPDQQRLALDRTVLANERTWLAWLRTGLALLAGGLAVAKFMRMVLPGMTALFIASLLILMSIAVFMLATWRYSSIRLRMAHLDIDALPAGTARAISGFLALCAACALVGLWIMALAG